MDPERELPGAKGLVPGCSDHKQPSRHLKNLHFVGVGKAALASSPAICSLCLSPPFEHLPWLVNTAIYFTSGFKLMPFCQMHLWWVPSLRSLHVC